MRLDYSPFYDFKGHLSQQIENLLDLLRAKMGNRENREQREEGEGEEGEYGEAGDKETMEKGGWGRRGQ